MGQVVPSDLAKNLLPGLRTEFMNAYKEVARPFERISTLVPSSHLSEDYTWLGQTPGMREFGAERIPKGLTEFTYTIRNKKWESSVRVDNDALRFEQYGQIKARINALGGAIPRHKNKLVFEILEAGFTTTGYDGQYFFDTDHSEGSSGTQSNKGTTALSAASYAAARAALRKFKDDQGELLGIGYGDLLLVVPAELEATALAILNAELVSDGTTTINNIWKGTATLLVAPFLTDANNWYLVDASQFLKPIILQQVGNDQNFGLVDTKGGDDDFMRDHVNYGVGPVHYNVGFADWRVAYGALVA